MSMNYYAVNDYGLLLTDDTMKHIASVLCEDFSETDYDDDPCSFNEEIGFAEYIFSFTGEAMKINEDGSDDWRDAISYYDDDLYILPVTNYPSLFRAGYSSIEDLIAEEKKITGEYLPEGFDYRSNIRHIVGTTFG